jgi:hypothetical protein
MIRLSVTDLESLRYFKSAEDATLDKLLLDLAHVSAATPKMEAGGAMAKFFETVDCESVVGNVTVDGWTLCFALDDAIDLPQVREMKIEQEFKTPSGLVTLVGKVDGFHGVTVRDQKLTESLDAEGRYIESLQWRAYLTMLGAKRFVYDVFVGKVVEEERTVLVREYHKLPFYAYPEMQADVTRAVCELAEVVARHQTEIDALKEVAKRKESVAGHAKIVEQARKALQDAEHFYEQSIGLMNKAEIRAEEEIKQRKGQRECNS